MAKAKQQEVKHSQLPWAVGVRQELEGQSYVAIGDATDWVVARTATDVDAAFIVRAVNKHDALVEALGELLNRFYPHTCDRGPLCAKCGALKAAQLVRDAAARE